MATTVEALDRIFYPAYEDNWDDIFFRKRILAYLEPEHTVLDLGAGSGLVTQMDFRGRCRAVYGVDPEEPVLSNPHLDFAKIGAAESIPAEADTFDLIFADNVLEHLQDPAKVFREIHRTLKPGGIFLAKTPNRFHYVPLIAQVTPIWFHRLVNKLRGRNEADTFPTLYRANSKGKLLKLADGGGLGVLTIEQIEGRPEYMRVSSILYPLGLLWERTVNATRLLSGLRILLIAVFQKPGVCPTITAASQPSLSANTDKAHNISARADHGQTKS